MTSNDYDARLARLETAKQGDTITVPDDWEKPAAADVDLEVSSLLIDTEPGDVFTHDGSDDGLPWWHDDHGHTFTTDLARLGFDVDGHATATDQIDEAIDKRIATSDALADEDDQDGDEPIGSVSDDGIELDENRKNDACCGCPECARLCHGCDACEPDDDEEGGPIGSVTVEVVPDVSGFADALKSSLEGTSVSVDVDNVTAQRPTLDEFQLERVAALEHSLRILESRRAPKASDKGALANLFSQGTLAPMVGKRDLIDVAAFISIGETGVSA